MSKELRKAFYDADGALAIAAMKAKDLAAQVEEAIEAPARAYRASIEALHADLMAQYQDALKGVVEATEASSAAKQALVDAYRNESADDLPRGIVQRRKRVIRIYDKKAFLESAPRQALTVDEKYINKVYEGREAELPADGTWGVEVDVTVAIYAEKLADEFIPDFTKTENTAL
jgi:hypothetical protein